MRRFPAGKYGRQKLEFFAAPYRAPLRSFVSLVFCWHDDKVLVCDIIDRGWCIPSGRVEPDESSPEAAVREALEEAGAHIFEPIYLGCYRMTEKQEVRWADVYTAHIRELGEITMPQESRASKLVDLSELPDFYYMWSPLTEQLFHYSREVLDRQAMLGYGPCAEQWRKPG